ncbi:MAG: substrate-binding domain-containing protein [Armatimonas sp.]
MSQTDSNEASRISCPHCGSSERQVRAGTNNGIQRYKCGLCKRRYTPQATGVRHSEDVRAQALQLHTQGLPLREIARQLGVNHQSVANWVRPPQGAPTPAITAPPSAGKPRPTINDVARRAGVSTACVSNYLNQKGRMAEATAQRIQAAMQALHFTPSALVRAIKQRRTQILGVMLPSLDSLDETEGAAAYLIPALLRGIHDGADAANHDLLLYTGGQRRSEDELEARFLGGHIDGLIWMTMGKRPPLLDRVVGAGLPIVALLTHEVPAGVSYVTADNRDAMRQLVQHLAEHEHRHIAYVGPESTTDFRDRHTGYRQALHALGLPHNPALQVIQPKQDCNLAGSKRILAEWLALPTPPTAILCSNDHTAAQFAEAIRARGLRIPEDIALAGFDDMPIAEHVAGGLTTIHQPFRQLGQLAAEKLLALVHGTPVETYETVLPTELVVRGSTYLSP